MGRFDSGGDDLKVEVSAQGQAAVLTPRGEVTAFTSPVLRQTLRAATASKPPKVVMDLSATPYVDSSGVATLVEALQIVTRYGGKLVLAGMNDRVRGVFEIARLQSVFKITANLQEALAT